MHLTFIFDQLWTIINQPIKMDIKPILSAMIDITQILYSALIDIFTFISMDFRRFLLIMLVIASMVTSFDLFKKRSVRIRFRIKKLAILRIKKIIVKKQIQF